MAAEQENMFQEFVSSFKNEVKEMGHVNLIISGKTGVGKSTLINAAFTKDVAETGVGEPVTTDIRLYTQENYPLRIYDTMGLELNADRQKHSVGQIIDLCKEKKRKGNPDELIHVMWYCVNGNSARFEQFEADFVNEVAEEMPVVIVLTQCIIKHVAEELKKEIEKKNLKAKNVILVRAKKFIDDDGTVKPAFGLDSLVEFTSSILPEATRRAWANAQKASLKIKQNRSHALVMTTATVSFGEGYIPLPFSDSVALVPIQVGMLAGITAIYGFELSKAVMTGIVSSLIGTTGTQVARKTIVSNIIKMIPGAGTVIGGTINGTTAATLTIALGETYIQVMNKMFKGEISEKDIRSDEFRTEMSKAFKRNLLKTEVSIASPGVWK